MSDQSKEPTGSDPASTIGSISYSLECVRSVRERMAELEHSLSIMITELASFEDFYAAHAIPCSATDETIQISSTVQPPTYESHPGTGEHSSPYDDERWML